MPHVFHLKIINHIFNIFHTPEWVYFCLTCLLCLVSHNLTLHLSKFCNCYCNNFRYSFLFNILAKDFVFQNISAQSLNSHPTPKVGILQKPPFMSSENYTVIISIKLYTDMVNVFYITISNITDFIVHKYISRHITLTYSFSNSILAPLSIGISTNFPYDAISYLSSPYHIL